MRSIILICCFLLCSVAGMTQSFTADKQKGCVPHVAEFSVDEPVKSCEWDFGNGQKSNLPQPKIIFGKAGSYTVSVTLELIGGGIKQLSVPGFIEVEEQVVLDFNVSATTVCEEGALSFEIQNPSNQYTYNWDFGDGSSNVGASVSKVFPTNGNYKPTVIATSLGGCVAAKTYDGNIVVKQNPVVTIQVDSNVICDPSVPVNMEVKSKSALATFNWLIEGNTYNTSSVSHLFATRGNVGVVVDVLAANGCSTRFDQNDFFVVNNAEVIDVAVSDSAVCVPAKLSFATNSAVDTITWYLGSTSIGKKAFNFDVKGESRDLPLRIEGVFSNGCSFKKDLAPIVLKEKPSVGFTIVKVGDCYPRTYVLKDTTSNSFMRLWSTFVGDIELDEEIALTLDGPKATPVSLTVVDDKGCSATKTVSQLVAVESEGVNIQFSEPFGCQPLNVTYSGVGQNVESFDWIFSNGVTKTGNNGIVTFDDAGDYDALVVTRTSLGCVDTIAFSDIAVVYDTLIYFHEPDTIISCADTKIELNGKWVGGDFWDWDLGNGIQQKGMKVLANYSIPGTYEVTLKTKNYLGCESTIAPYEVIIIKNLVESVNISITDCPNKKVNLIANSTTPLTLTWDVGDSIVYNGNNIDHAFLEYGIYTVNLIAEDAEGCKQTFKYMNGVSLLSCDNGGLPVDPDEFLVIAAGIDKIEDFLKENGILIPVIETSGCAPYGVDFNDPFNGLINIAWDFGDGNVTDESIVSHTYTNVGEYTVKLYIQDWSGNVLDSLVYEKSVKVLGSQIDFNSSQISSCQLRKEVMFAAAGDDYVSWNWKHKQRLLSKKDSFEYSFPKSSDYLIQLEAKTIDGCSQSMVRNVTVGMPKIGFGYMNELCADEEISISHSLNNPENTFVWDFGDGNVSTDVFPKHAYQDAGVYTMNVTIGLPGTNCDTSLVLPLNVKVLNPIADFSLVDSVFCDTTELKITNNSIGSSVWKWSLNGAVYLEKNPVIILETSGDYVLTLETINGKCFSKNKVEKQVHLSNHIADFDVSFINQCSPVVFTLSDKSIDGIVSNWRMGNLIDSGLVVTTMVEDMSVLGNKKVLLISKDSFGCVSRKERSLNIEFSKFDLFPAELCANSPLDFELKGNRIESINWLFGDGSTSTNKTITHSYSQDGIYEVGAVVTYVSGCVDTLHISDSLIISSVKANLSINSLTSGCVPLVVSFSDSSISNKIWYFGDGSTSEMNSPIHSYPISGMYDLALKVIDSKGCEDSIYLEKAINAMGPGASFDVTKKSGCIPFEIPLVDGSRESVKRTWFLGDGATSEQAAFDYTFEKVGVYDITLLAYDEFGCMEHMKIDSIVVGDYPQIGFQLSDSIACIPYNLTIIDTSKNLYTPKYSWVVGGDKYETKDVSLSVKSQKAMDVSLKIENMGGCSDQLLVKNALVVRDTLMVYPIVNLLDVINNSVVKLSATISDTLNARGYSVYERSAEDTAYSFVLNVSNGSLMNGVTLHLPDVDKEAYTFVIDPISECGSSNGVSTLTSHTTMRLEIKEFKDRYLLSWGNELNIPVVDFSLFSKKKGDGTYTFITSTSSTEYEFNTKLCPGDYEFKVIANHVSTASGSTSAYYTPDTRAFYFEAPIIKNTTVVDDQAIFLEWHVSDKVSLEMVDYLIVKRKQGNLIQEVAKINNHSTSYLDYDVSIDDSEYRYFVELKNNCTDDTFESGSANTILLSKKTSNFMNSIKWNKYEGWQDDVQHYEIQVLNAHGQWETIKVVDHSKTEYTIDIRGIIED